MKIGNVIKEVRSEKKISQGELAKNCDVTQSYLSQIENDIKMPSNDLLVQIGKNLNVPVSVLYYLAIEETDVPKDNLQAYQQLSSTIKSLVKSVYF
jgi:XRE family transcriptional regulator, regulator of sulfur utilization